MRACERNIARVMKIRHGDVDAAFRDSDAVVEGTFKTPLVHQAYLEPHSVVAQWDLHGRLTLWIPAADSEACTDDLRECPRHFTGQDQDGPAAHGRGLRRENWNIGSIPLCALLARKADRHR